jgi:hypothetical protein
MTEADWLSYDDPRKMLEFLQSRASERKLRLFACGCCRRIWHKLRDARSRRAVEVGELYADAATDAAALSAALWDAGRVLSELQRLVQRRPARLRDWQVVGVPVICARLPAWPNQEWAVGEALVNSMLQIEPDQSSILVGSIRCLFGNPFNQVTVAPAWLSPTVVSLARAIYDDRAFDRLPILADALEDAGCNNADLLNHLRQPGQHVLGCWALDLVLGKE